MKNDKSTSLILCLFGILPVVWLGLLIAPAAHGGLPEIVARFPAVIVNANIKVSHLVEKRS